MAKVVKRNNSSKTAIKSTKRTPSQEAMNDLIQKKAYELYEKRGYTHGNDWNDWLEAERIIKSRNY